MARRADEIATGQWRILSGLSADDQREVLAAGRVRRFARREVVFHAGDPGDTLFLLRRGHLAVRTETEYGDTVTLAVLGPGDTLGELAVLGRAPVRSATAIALEATETLSLSRAQLAGITRSHPGVERLLIDVLVEQVRRLSGQLVEALHVPVRHRVVRRLLDLAEQYDAGTSPIVLAVTQQDVADLAGATRPTVNQVLRALEDAGAISLGRGSIEVLDVAALTRARG